MIIDTHCHFDMMPNPEAYINEREKAGEIVIGMTNLPSHFAMGASHVRQYKHIRLALGLHPLLAAENKNEVNAFKRYIEKTSYIGEIGLDFSKEGFSTKDSQIDILRELLTAIRDKRKIVSAHSRRAEKELLDLLCEYEIPNVIFHWYSGPVSLIPAILERGYYFSVNEAMCYSQKGRQIIDAIPWDRLLTETDAPYNNRCNITRLLETIGLDEKVVYNNFKRLLATVG